LPPKGKEIHDKDLVLKQLHNDLDTAVFDAYGWPATLTDAEILERLVALNAERAKEESQGKIRWLRPDYQIPLFTKKSPELPLPIPSARAPRTLSPIAHRPSPIPSAPAARTPSPIPSEKKSAIRNPQLKSRPGLKRCPSAPKPSNPPSAQHTPPSPPKHWPNNSSAPKNKTSPKSSKPSAPSATRKEEKKQARTRLERSTSSPCLG
jgi:hypothetical protein